MIVIPIVLLLVGSAWSQEKCPVEQDVKPCSCYAGYPTTVVCDSGKTVDDIRGVLSRIKGKQVAITFDHIRFGDMPSNLFRGQMFSGIAFMDCRINSIDSTLFKGLENYLNSIEIDNSGTVNAITNLNFGDFKQLRQISMSRNSIPKVGNKWFEEGPESLEALSLADNNINDLGDTAFESLTNLKELLLPYNDISSVQRSMFPQPSQLTMIKLSYNHIIDLPVDLFSDMAELKAVNLENNKLVTLSKEPWAAVWNHLDAVNVISNPIVCDRRIRWIYQNNLRPNYFVGRCSSPRDFRNTDLRDLQDSDFHWL